MSEAEGSCGEHVRYGRIQWLVVQLCGAAISRTQLELLHIVATCDKLDVTIIEVGTPVLLKISAYELR